MLKSVLVCAFCIILSGYTAECSWPRGIYGIPKPKTGCPEDLNFQWKSGMRKHETKFGSHSSEHSELAGSSANETEHVVQEFCMKVHQAAPDDRDAHFMPGKYCIFKKGKCPSMFKDGWIYWDDGSSWLWTTTQTTSGILPDGTFNRNTKIEYCCRVDGQTSLPIILPTQQPFYLLQYGDTCQEVQDMLVREEWLYWVDEWVMNYNKAEGFHPRIIRNPKYTTLLYYCYYYPISGTDTTDPRLSSYLQRNAKFKNSNNSNYSFGWQTFLTILYVTAAVTGMIFLLAILLAGGQRIIIHFRRRRRKQHQQQSRLNRSATPNTALMMMVSSDGIADVQMVRRAEEDGGCAATRPARIITHYNTNNSDVLLNNNNNSYYFKSHLTPPPYQQLLPQQQQRSNLVIQRLDDNSTLLCEEGEEPPPAYEDVLMELMRESTGSNVPPPSSPVADCDIPLSNNFNYNNNDNNINMDNNINSVILCNDAYANNLLQQNVSNNAIFHGDDIQNNCNLLFSNFILQHSQDGNVDSSVNINTPTIDEEVASMNLVLPENITSNLNETNSNKINLSGAEQLLL